MEVNPSTSEKRQKDCAKRELKDALVHCTTLLEEEGLIDTEPSTTMSESAMEMGKEIYDRVVDMLGEKTFISDEDLIQYDKEHEEGGHVEPESPDEHFAEDDDADYVPEEKRPGRAEFIPLETKMKVVRLAKEHPTWSLRTLQAKGSRLLKRKDELKLWEESIKKGGTIFDKYALIDSWTYDRFLEARNNHQQVTTRNLQQWALAAAAQFQSDTFTFKASEQWVQKFKQRHRIRQTKITRYVSDKKCASLEDTLEAARKFQIRTRTIIPKFNERFVINTEQTECRYQSTFFERNAESANKISDSYTAQYAITLSGELLPHVFLCLQESTRNFGPRVMKIEDDLTKPFPNVIVTCSKSGKLTTDLYSYFLTNVMLPYVGQEKFLLIIDSQPVQTNPALYDEIFIDDAGLPTCTLKVIPPECASICQPCDVYFYREVKHFVKRIQSCTYLTENRREINSREDAVKIHSLVHNQLSAPIFKNTLRYAWWASKLSCADRPNFSNVNDVCFSVHTLNKPCGCGQVSFIQCSRCRSNLCFPCFYDEYHPAVCNAQDASDD